MIAFRYRLKNVPMKIAEKSFKVDGVDFPAGSFVITDAGGSRGGARGGRAVRTHGGGALGACPTVATHDADVPRVAIYSQWTGTQDLGWYRLTFDKFGIPYDLIYKERVTQGDLKSEVRRHPHGGTEHQPRSRCSPTPSATPQPYQKSDKYKFLGMYGETADMSGGFGQEGVDAFEAFLDGGGTLIAAATRFASRSTSAGRAPSTWITVQGVTAQRPLVKGEIAQDRSSGVLRVRGHDAADQVRRRPGAPGRQSPIRPTCSARYVGGDARCCRAAHRRRRPDRVAPFAVDIPDAYNGKGRVILFSNNPIYRWQNHGEFNMIFNSIINWNDAGAK